MAQHQKAAKFTEGDSIVKICGKMSTSAAARIARKLIHVDESKDRPQAYGWRGWLAIY